MKTKFENNNFHKRMKSMLGVDFRRMFTSSIFYIMLGIAFVMPILILVMTTMMDGSVSVNPQTGEETVIEGFKNVWQILGSVQDGVGNQELAMDITSMCNINMIFFVFAVFVCVFIGDEFRSGYVKNLFTVRAKKDDYIVSKTITCFVAGGGMIIAFFCGAMLGGKFAGLSFTLQGVTMFNVVMSMLSKISIMLIFSSIYIVASVVAKQKLWLSLLMSLGIGMLFFMMIPLITPLNSGVVNFVMCFVGSLIFSIAISFGSKAILEKTNLI